MEKFGKIVRFSNWLTHYKVYTMHTFSTGIYVVYESKGYTRYTTTQYLHVYST